MGEKKFLFDCVPSMASEYFAFMLKEKQGAYIWLGVDGDSLSAKLHNPLYDFNDGVLETGMMYWVRPWLKSTCSFPISAHISTSFSPELGEK